MQFAVMGTTAHLVIVGGPDRLYDHARERLHRLELKWSRFLVRSELSQLNERPGRLVVLSPETYAVVERAVDSWWRTAGRFDPTILRALRDAGYDRTFAEIVDAPSPAGSAPAPGCKDIRLWPLVEGVTLPVGVELDLGGIGKGYAADLIARELMVAGARGACVNVGGDLRAVGEAPTDDGWVVGVDNPMAPGDEVGRIILEDGAVATTTSTKRRWVRNGKTRHHLIDPATGESAVSPWAAVTVVAGEAWQAEVLAKALFLAKAEDAENLLAAWSASALLFDHDGEIHSLSGMEVHSA